MCSHGCAQAGIHPKQDTGLRPTGHSPWPLPYPLARRPSRPAPTSTLSLDLAALGYHTQGPVPCGLWVRLHCCLGGWTPLLAECCPLSECTTGYLSCRWTPGWFPGLLFGQGCWGHVWTGLRVDMGFHFPGVGDGLTGRCRSRLVGNWPVAVQRGCSTLHPAEEHTYEESCHPQAHRLSVLTSGFHTQPLLGQHSFPILIIAPVPSLVSMSKAHTCLPIVLCMLLRLVFGRTSALQMFPNLWFAYSFSSFFFFFIFQFY